MTVHLISTGSLVISGVALMFALYLVVDSLSLVGLPGRLWPAGFSLGLSVYSGAVFAQYNAVGVDAQILIERWQYAGLIVLVASLLGYNYSFVHPEAGRRSTATYLGPAAFMVVLVFTLPGMYQAQLVDRVFMATDFTYREPIPGAMGSVVFALVSVVGIYGGLRFVQVATFRGITGWLIRAGVLVWLLTAVNDIAGSLGAPIPMYLLEYGFLAFLAGILATVRHQHAEMVRTIQHQREQIATTYRNLESEVARRTAQLAEVAEGLRRRAEEHRITAEELKQKNRERTVLIKEVHHRSKNNLQLISSLLNLSVSHGKVQSVADLVELHQTRIHAMAAVHEQLHNAEDFASIELDRYLHALVSQLETAMVLSSQNITTSTALDPITVSVDQAIPMGLWVNEVLTNSYQHAFTDRDSGEIRVVLTRRSGEIQLTVADNGPGMPLEALSHTAGLGSILIESLPAQIGGRLERVTDGGLRCTLYLPEESAVE
jgi:two-component sensor histidine kinase